MKTISSARFSPMEVPALEKIRGQYLNFNNAIAWVAWGHILKEAVERIEIVRGPTSVLYGSEGLGGVIHIIAKNP